METIKSFTDLSQSKTLGKILPIESADMAYFYMKNSGTLVNPSPFVLDGTEVREDGMFIYLNCWSLAALLNILAKIASKIDDDGSAALSSFMGQWSINMFDCPIEATDNYDNPVDACVAMIEKLHKLKLL